MARGGGGGGGGGVLGGVPGSGARGGPGERLVRAGASAREGPGEGPAPLGRIYPNAFATTGPVSLLPLVCFASVTGTVTS